MSKAFLKIQSHKGEYDVSLLEMVKELPVYDSTCAFIIDKRVFDLHKNELEKKIIADRCVFIEATEDTKSLEHAPIVIEQLLSKNFRRGQTLVAIGGGITQDLTCFVAATLFRGVDWQLIPTTLLAQSDSCIGSKSSINLKGYKNIVGTFTPPQKIYICSEFLDTLPESDLRSGIGEILKIHLIAGSKQYPSLFQDYGKLLTERKTLLNFIKNSLELKKPFIENDEFDQKERLVLNYGHTFGHAIEAATQFTFPHGISVTIGIDMANFVSAKLGLSKMDLFFETHPVLKQNFTGFDPKTVNWEKFKNAFMKDKKHSADGVRVILPDADDHIKLFHLPFDQNFQDACKTYLLEAGGT